MNCYCCTSRRGQGILSRFFSSSSAGGVGVKNDETLKQSTIRFWFIMHLGSACLAAVSYLDRKIHTVEEWQSWNSLPIPWILKLFKQYAISLTEIWNVLQETRRLCFWRLFKESESMPKNTQMFKLVRIVETLFRPNITCTYVWTCYNKYFYQFPIFLAKQRN